MKQTEASGIPVHCSHDKMADVTELVENPKNPQKHSDQQVALLAKIIRHTGWRSPVVVSRRSGFIVAGHGRLAAAKLLQVEKVPVNFQDFANEADEYAHIIADNRISELAETDGGKLKDLLIELDSLTEDFDMDLTGFDDVELERVINFYPSGETEEEKEPKSEPKQSDDDYSMFQLVMFHENKTALMDALNEIKARDGIETNEDALMQLVKLHNKINQ